MGVRWQLIGFNVLTFLVLIIGLKVQRCWSLNDEGLVLLAFRARVNSDPFGAFSDWNPRDSNPCSWSGVHCVADKVQILDLNSQSLEGTLAPELGKLIHLRSLILFKNHFSGTIPKEIGELAKLELLDLRDNNLSGTVPVEIGKLTSLNCLLLCDNNIEGGIPPEIRNLSQLSELQFDEDLAAAPTRISYVNRKLGHCMWQSGLNRLNRAGSFIIPIKGALTDYLNSLRLQQFKLGKHFLNGFGDSSCDKPLSSSVPYLVQNVEIVKFARRRLFDQSINLAAAPASSGLASQQIIALPTTRSSGSFPAVPNAKKKPLSPPADSPPKETNSSSVAVRTGTKPPSASSGNTWIYFLIIPIVAVLLIVFAGLVFVFRKRVATTIGPWKTGLSGQLQRRFVTGVPKLNRQELETACEDFSNIIETLDGCTVYKGTLSSGVEIAVVSTAITSSKDWSRNAELAYRKKIDMLSRVNHKNFANLLGYCEENEPFCRMIVFEYAPNGSLFEHLHVKEMEHLDWSARTRIIMGTAYCLQYMHHDLNPPVAHSTLNTHNIYLTDDYAAKIAEISFSAPAASKRKISSDNESEHSTLPPLADPETNVYGFGILLLEIISGKLPYSEEQGPVEKWAAEYLNDKRSISSMIDPTLKSFKNNELDVICEVIQECIHPDPRKRPTMKEITSKLREVIAISPEQATPRLSPLWWAELEILSVEAT
ncbi:hypothetical protein K2173_001614 [Erythroxylum novogranatense]|uniref:Protein kinase domain-containing protein n=1 Tax=Erythroxylum novogranatense TaxID=1862640 RepID=A0AAV8T416_9ROSI|nr:hypothetical protein K2173_001614 [Erythroxylum novogranatense]